jgi:hypothetical protein
MRTRALTLGICSVFMALIACSSEGSAPTDSGDDASGDADVQEILDTGLDGDSGSTGPEEIVTPSIFEKMCATEETGDIENPAMHWADATKFSLSVYHFNLQYVAGGIKDFLNQSELSDAELHDLIITESFEPLVAIFERNPDWGGSFEMQGLFLEVLAERFPELLLRFGRLVRRGQVDLMSFHYSDQLYLAYPYRDQKWSWDRNERIREALCLPPSPAFFTQEGQYGPGMVDFITKHNGGVAILPRNLLRFNLGEDFPRALWFDRDGSPVISTDGFEDPATGWALRWNFVDDAELLCTGGINPYFPDAFFANDAAIADYEAKLRQDTEEGYLVTTLREYRRQLEANNIPRADLPPIHDGQWQSDAGDNLFQWMGYGAGWAGDERDNTILTGNVRVSRLIRAAELLMEDAAAAGHDVADQKNFSEWLDEAKRLLLLAEVSDSTGWRPYIIEIAYSLDYQAEAEKAAMTTLGELMALLELPDRIWIDLSSGEIRTEQVMAEPPEPLEAFPVAMAVEDGGRGAEIRLQDHFGHHAEAWITFPPRTPETSGSLRPEALAVRFDVALEALAYSPALSEDRVLTTAFADYSFEVNQDVTPKRRICLGAPNGLIGLGQDRWLLKDTGRIHVAACVSPEGVFFEDQTQPNQEAVTWRFLYFEGSEAEALDFAKRVNVEPEIVVSLP